MSAILASAPLITEHLQCKLESQAYGVYLCYHEADEAQVLQIGEKLKAVGILPCLDTVDMQPGLPVRMQQEDNKTMSNSRCGLSAPVCLSKVHNTKKC